ncbi:MAG: NUDIX hydrolase [Trebonia sp.]
MHNLLAKLWRLAKPLNLQWRILWFMHAKFICGVTGIVRDDQGRVLLLRHRLWPEGRQWGFPTGYANRGERHEDTIAREVREETGLTVKAGRLLKVRSGFRYRIEVYYEAALVADSKACASTRRKCSKPACSASATCPTECPRRTGNSPQTSEPWALRKSPPLSLFTLRDVPSPFSWRGL